MAGKMYLGVGSVAKQAKKMYIGVGGVAKKVSKMYIGVGGKAQLCYSAAPVAIDMGTEAISRTGGAGLDGYTLLVKANPANANGYINTVELYFNTDATEVKVAVFYLVSADHYAARSVASIGSVAAGAKRTYSVNLAVQAGDFIGYYSATGRLMSGSPGTGYAYNNSDATNGSTYWFSNTADRTLSLYGSGIG